MLHPLLLMIVVVWCPSLVRLNLSGCCDLEGKTSVVECYRLAAVLLLAVRAGVEGDGLLGGDAGVSLLPTLKG